MPIDFREHPDPSRKAERHVQGVYPIRRSGTRRHRCEPTLARAAITSSSAVVFPNVRMFRGGGARWDAR